MLGGVCVHLQDERLTSVSSYFSKRETESPFTSEGLSRVPPKPSVSLCLPQCGSFLEAENGGVAGESRPLRAIGGVCGVL